MILQSITLDNIRSYTYQEICFPPGSVLLSGDIGAGKSTILHAIEFALFGIQRGELSGSSLLRHGKNEGFVQLCFSLQGKDIIIRRALKRTKQGIQQDAGHLVIDGSMIEATPIELRARILSMLGYPKDILKAKSFIYRYTVYTPQEEMKHILFDERDSRLDTIRRIFGIDKYKQIGENAALIARGFRDHKRFLENALVGLDEKKKQQGQHQADKDRLTLEMDGLKAKLEQVRTAKEKQKQELHHAEEELKRVTELQQQARMKEAAVNERTRLHSTYQQERATLLQQLGALRQRLHTFPQQETSQSKEVLEHAIAEREKRIRLALQQEVEVREKHSAIHAQLASIEHDLRLKQQTLSQHTAKQEEFRKRSSLPNNKPALRQELQQAETQLQLAIRHVQEQEIHIRRAAETIDKINQMDHCPLCLQPVSQGHKYEITAEENRKAEEHKSILQGFSQQRTALEEQQKRLQQMLEQMQENETRLAKLQAELASLARTSEEAKEKERQREHLLGLRQKLQLQQETLGDFNLQEQQVLLEKEKSLYQQIVEMTHLHQMLQEKEVRHHHLEGLLKEGDQAISSLHHELQDIRKQLDGKADLDQRYLHLRQERDALLEEEKHLEVRHASLEKEHEGITRFLTLLSAEVHGMEQARLQALQVSRLHGWLEDSFLNLMKVIERQVMLRVYQEFNELFQ